MVKPNKKQDWGAIIDFLQSVSEQSEENGLGYAFTTQEAHAECLNLGYVVVDLNVSNEQGYATKITASGIEVAGIEVNEEVAEEVPSIEFPLESEMTEAVTTPASSAFPLVLLAELPTVRRRAAKIDLSQFPIEVMEPGHSFFLAMVEGCDEKKFKSDCANIANRASLKFSTKNDGKITYTKKFASRVIEDVAAYGQPNVPGVIIFRSI